MTEPSARAVVEAFIRAIVVRDGKIAKTTSSYAPPFEALAWRAPYVERMNS